MQLYVLSELTGWTGQLVNSVYHFDGLVETVLP